MTDANNADPFAQTTNEQINYLEQLVGEGKKFSDVSALAKGKYEADQFVETLKRENEELRRKAEQGMALKDLYEAIKTNPPAPAGQPPVQPEVTTPATASPPAQPGNQEDLIREALKKIELERKETENKNAVVSRLNEVWGNGTAQKLSEASGLLGISVADLEAMGKRSPAALFKLLGVDSNPQAPSGTTAPTSTVTIPSNNSGVRDKKYYDNLRLTNRKLFESAKVQVQMHKDALALGEKFFN